MRPGADPARQRQELRAAGRPLMRRVAKILPAAVCALLLAGHMRGAEIRLSAAVSLREAVNELSGIFAGRRPGVRFLRNYGASGMLARQIESGAPADIFISANSEWTDHLRNKGLLDAAGLRIFAYNTLVFAGASGKASSLRDLPALRRIAICSPGIAPAGRYAMEALRRAGIAGQLEGKLLMAKDVRECLMYAERGEVDGAFVYRTDALRSKEATILFTVPQELYPRVAYPMAMTVPGARNRDAAAFFSFLSGAEAKTVLARHGFAVR